MSAEIADGSEAVGLRDNVPEPLGRSGWLRVLVAYRPAIVGIAIIVLITIFCFVGPLLYHSDQVHTSPANALTGPGHAHPLGTDALGYDVLGRLMKGGQSTMIIGVAAALLSGLVGAIWGALAGYRGGVVDTVMMRVVDTVSAVPPILVIVFVAAVATPNILLLVAVITATHWVNTARLVRGEALSLRSREYVLAAKAVGASDARIVGNHILRNTASSATVQVTFEIANSILTLSTLSFLGLGIPPPEANWGGMLSDGLDSIYMGAWWLIYPAGLLLVFLVVAFNFVGEGLRDSLEVRLQVG